jgi:hypothetical protein
MRNKFEIDPNAEDAVLVGRFDTCKTLDDVAKTLQSEELLTRSGDPYTLRDLAIALDTARATRFHDMAGFTSVEGLRSNMARLLIPECENPAELSNLLVHIHSLTNDEGVEYAQKDLIAKIQDYLDGKIPIDMITRTAGLRDVVKKF